MRRRIISISGVVQGVGFRPFIYRLAQHYNLAGIIRNTGQGVHIDVQGKEADIDSFQKAIITEKPQRASITEWIVTEAPLHHILGFTIETSEIRTDTSLALLPDTAMCTQCQQELFDPRNRRYLYPFLHCVACGPRFSLFLRMPFDRHNTSMKDFVMCSECLKEYEDPFNRRFYSQTNCCTQCGPQLCLTDHTGKLLAYKYDAVSGAIHALQKGQILAVKNTGGYQILVDATNEEAVRRLRQRKRRNGKPFALLMKHVAAIRSIAIVCPAAEEALTEAAAPIVLLKRRQDPNTIAPSVAPGSPYYGVMLPHTGLQHLIMNNFEKPLVATSGNLSGKPLCINDQEAWDQLSTVVDLFLMHNRQIIHRLDDSIVHIIDGRPMVLRRARGYIPFALQLPQSTDHLFAAGGHQKSSFALVKHNKVYLSQHIGNLETADTCRAYDHTVEQWKQLLSIHPQHGVRDKHPEYYSSHYLQNHYTDTFTIQHHHAHTWAGMIDNLMEPPFLSIAWDGTGWGDDLTVWGGEAFIFGNQKLTHYASLYPFRLPGGEKAILEPRRSALGVLDAMGHQTHALWLHQVFSQEELSILRQALAKGINAPLCTSMGRLFDAVSALTGGCIISQYEGHAPLALESLAHRVDKTTIAYDIPVLQNQTIFQLDWRPMIAAIIADLTKGRPGEEIAYAFHDALAQAIVALAQHAQHEKVLLTGGVMQNKLLTELAIRKLRNDGFKPFWHQHIPPNDGGLAVGQVVGLQISNTNGANHVSCGAGENFTNTAR